MGIMQRLNESIPSETASHMTLYASRHLSFYHGHVSLLLGQRSSLLIWSLCLNEGSRVLHWHLLGLAEASIPYAHR